MTRSDTIAELEASAIYEAERNRIALRYNADEMLSVMSRVRELERALDLILPMAHEHARQHPVGSNKRYIRFAEDTLADTRPGARADDT